MKVLSDALWNIDEHHEKIDHRAKFNSEISQIPDRFSTCRGFYDNRRKKHAVRLDRKSLQNVTANLFQVLSLPIYWNESWNRLHGDLEKLAMCLRFYVENMEKETQSQQLRPVA